MRPAEAVDRAIADLQANDAGREQCFSPRVSSRDGRPFAGALTTGIEYVSRNYSRVVRTVRPLHGPYLAVRGDLICLAWTRWSDETGNESSNRNVIAVVMTA